jgi:hypothetical protein
MSNYEETLVFNIRCGDISLVVSQTDDNWTSDDLISGWNFNKRSTEWLQILPSNPAEMVGCIGELAFGSDEYCTGSDELIRYNDQYYIVQNIDLDYLYNAWANRSK